MHYTVEKVTVKHGSISEFCKALLVNVGFISTKSIVWGDLSYLMFSFIACWRAQDQLGGPSCFLE